MNNELVTLATLSFCDRILWRLEDSRWATGQTLSMREGYYFMISHVLKLEERYVDQTDPSECCY